jgi:predicted anti-sigma-YlaC factor YlaD
MMEQLAEFLDKDARAELCRTIEQHLTQCRDCRFLVDSVKKTIVLYQSDREVEVPVVVSAQLQAALAREYCAAQKRD